MIVEKSERGVLITNASFKQTDYQYSLFGLLPNSWTQEDNYTITYKSGTPLNPPSGSWIFMNYAEFSPSTTPDYELEWALVIYNRSSANSIISESSWYPVNTRINFTSQDLSGNQYFRYKIYLRRALDENGDRPQLSRSSMNGAGITFYGNLYYNEEQQTLPSDWFATTSATFQNPMDTYTTIIPTDYDISSSQYDPLLEIPSKIDTAINFIILSFGRIMNFRYISFVVCFVLIVGLVAWLIH